jgi:hypothetical protein
VPVSIDISDAAIRARIRSLSEARGLDANGLATRARVNPRVTREILSGARTRVRPRTLDAIARALRTHRTYLLTGDAALSPAGTEAVAVAGPRGLRSTRVIWTGFALAAIVIAAAAWLIRSGQPRTPRVFALEYTCFQRPFAVRDAENGTLVWDSTFANPTSFGVIAPWPGANMVLHGTLPQDSRGGDLVGRDILTGRPLWHIAHPGGNAADYFPADLIRMGRFVPQNSCGARDGCAATCVGDFDGDGVDDIAIRWVFHPWYPGCAAWYTVDPARPRKLIERARYYTCGRISTMMLHDIDGDGRPGVIVGGTNNARAYQGAMVEFLDADHWDGGSVDSLAGSTHWRPDGTLQDGSLARLIFPLYDDAELVRAFGIQRLDVCSLEVRGDTVSVGIGAGGLVPDLVVRLDTNLDVIDAHATQGGHDRILAAPEAVRERFNDDYLLAWARRRVHFGAGSIR